MEVNLGPSWSDVMQEEMAKPYFGEMMLRLDKLYESESILIFPAKEQVFNAFRACDFQDVKVIVLGQDPYPTKGYAHGLSFSVDPQMKKLPASLKNIFKEIEHDVGTSSPFNGNLERWSHQGVLLLNTILTVEEGKPGAHGKFGWDQFTHAVIQNLNKHLSHVVFILWGSHAQMHARYIDHSRHLIIQSVHPSPLSAYRGFFGSKPFSRANDYLKTHGKSPITW